MNYALLFTTNIPIALDAMNRQHRQTKYPAPTNSNWPSDSIIGIAVPMDAIVTANRFAFFMVLNF